MYLTNLFLTVLFSTFVMASTYEYDIGANFDRVIPVCNSPSLLWATMTSPLCLITIIGYTMLLISPYTRVLACDFLGLLRYIAVAIVQLVWRFFGNSPAEMEHLKHTWAEKEAVLHRERDVAVTNCQHAITLLEDLRSDKQKLAGDNVQLQSALNSTQQQLGLLQGTKSHQDKVHLEAEVTGLQNQLADRDQDVQDRDAKIQRLEQTLSSTSSEKQQAVQDAKEAVDREHQLRNRNDKLEADAKEQHENHCRESSKKDQQIALLQQVMHVLHQFAEQNDVHLSVAVLFAKGLQLSGISLVELGIDHRRLELLCDYVRADMRGDLAIQPQATEPGFRLKQRPYALSGLPSSLPTQNFIAASRHETPDTQKTLLFGDSTLGSSLLSNEGSSHVDPTLENTSSQAFGSAGSSYHSAVAHFGGASSLDTDNNQEQPANRPSLFAPAASNNSNTNMGSKVDAPFDALDSGNTSGFVASALANPESKQPTSSTAPFTGTTTNASPFASFGQNKNNPTTVASPFGSLNDEMDTDTSASPIASVGLGSTGLAASTSFAGPSKKRRADSSPLNGLNASPFGSTSTGSADTSSFASLDNKQTAPSAAPFGTSSSTSIGGDTTGTLPFTSIDTDNASVFGSSAFGTPVSASLGSGHTGTSPFGSSANKPSGSSFGAPAFVSAGFSSTIASPFGSSANKPSSSAFGTPAFGSASSGNTSFSSISPSPFAAFDNKQTTSSAPPPFSGGFAAASCSNFVPSAPGNPFLKWAGTLTGSTAGSLGDNPFMKVPRDASSSMGTLGGSGDPLKRVPKWMQ